MSKKAWYRKRLLTIFRLLVFIASCLYIIYLFSTNWSDIKSINVINNLHLLLTGLLSLTITVIALVSLSKAWLCLFTNSQGNERNILKIYLRSQVLKYLPGNIFHFAYRHYETKKLGFNHKELINNSLLETLGLISVSAIITFLLLSTKSSSEWLVNITKLSINHLLTIFFMIMSLSLVAVIKFKLYRPFLCYFLYFVAMGFCLYLLAQSLQTQSPEIYFFIPCYAISWLLGYILPGAPGGLGVRESVFVLISSELIPQHEALVLISTLRVITILGESIIYIIAKPISRFTLLLQA